MYVNLRIKGNQIRNHDDYAFNKLNAIITAEILIGKHVNALILDII